MRTRLPWLLVSTLLAIAAAVWAAPPPGSGIRDTLHDFSSRGGGVGLCTFCHTPHRGISTRLLWNHTLSTATYTWQDVDETIGGTKLPTITQEWTGPSKFCLSCHDGSVAIGDVNWWRSAKPAPLATEKHTWPSPVNVGATGGILSNMSGNHPVAFPYPYQQQKSTYNDVTTGDNVIVSEFVTDPTVNKIRLFNNPGGNVVVAGAVPGKTGIECSSCHDPHNGPTVEDNFFIRGRLRGNTLPYICLKCHSK